MAEQWSSKSLVWVRFLLPLLKKNQKQKKYIKTFKTLNLTKLPYKQKRSKPLKLSLPLNSGKGGVMSTKIKPKLKSLKKVEDHLYSSTIYIFLILFKTLKSSTGTRQLQPLLFNYNYYPNILAVNRIESFINYNILSLFNNKHLFGDF